MGEYNLQVTIDGDSGFCFGVVYAIDMAEEILAEDGYLYCLGDIVHNDEEVERLKAKGLRIIGHEQLKDLHNERVLIRAHCEAPDGRRRAGRAGRRRHGVHDRARCLLSRLGRRAD